MQRWMNRLGVAGLGAAVMLAGCQSPAVGPDGRRPIRTEADAEAFLAERHARLAADRSHEEADRLLQAMQKTSPPIQWQETPVPSPSPVAPPRREPAPRPEPVVPEPAILEVVTPSVMESSPPPAPPTREELLVALREQVLAERHGPMAPAVAEVIWNLLAGRAGLDEVAMASLNPEQRQQVQRFYLLFQLSEQRLLAGSFNREELQQQMDRIFGARPLAIRQVVLCRNVQGYGVFDPFPATTFLAGRSHRMILYIELDHFQHRALGQEFEVRLNQEVVLYNDADGLAVWRHEPVEVVDRSRNQRRDFFVVQIINLPARLSVGKYQLTVSVADKHGGSMDERRIELEMVADEKLVRSAEASAEERWQMLRDLLGGGGEEETGRTVQPR